MPTDHPVNCHFLSRDPLLREPPPPCDPPERLRELDCRAADGWLALGAEAWDCERAAVFVRAAVCDRRALFCTRCAVLVCGVGRDVRALFCERVPLLERVASFERELFIAERFAVERAAVV
jgi:hypothetical protein